MGSRVGLLSVVRRWPADVVRRSAEGGATRWVPALVRKTLGLSGEPLDAPTRAAVESRFGHDFSRVRVHTDARAGESAVELGADAYAFGNHIVFAPERFAPSTTAGLRLLTHELGHVVSEPAPAGPPIGVGSVNDGAERNADVAADAALAGRAAPRAPAQTGSGQVRRSLTVVDSGKKPPAAAGTALATNAALAESWLNMLCPTGTWSVDVTSGVASTPNRATLCGPTPSASNPVSCKCLCDVTQSGGNDVKVRVADKFKIGAEDVDVAKSGQGATLNPGAGRTDFNVGITGRTASLPGVGDTSPISGSGVAQGIRDPPWLIFGHEVCGHIGTGTSGHYQTAGGTTTAVDVENRIRREHSTTAASLGIRKGDFRADEDAAGNNNVRYEGSLIIPLPGEKVPALAKRLGIAKPEGNIFTLGGEWVPKSSFTTYDPKDGVFAVNVFFHDVISGETLADVARIWGVKEASLIRVNPKLAKSTAIAAGDRLLVPAS